MEIDKTTLADLVIFDRDDEFSIFNKVNFTNTTRGKEQLRKNLLQPLTSIEAITQIQDCISYLQQKKAHWSTIITNGTLMVVERFYDANIDLIPSKASALDALSYKVLHSHDYTLVKYSVRHCYDFIKGMSQFVQFYLNENTPIVLKNTLLEIKKTIANDQLVGVFATNKASDFTPAQMLALAHFIKYRFKLQMQELITNYSKLDAWQSMATANQTYNLCTPIFNTNDLPFIQASSLYHLMLQQPVPYDVTLNESTNFLFLTGANMAGKSTFIKACGTAVYLAHTGMGVPAQQMQLSFFDGILSNINVIDNIAKGESYFFNEVQRIKATIEKLNNGKKWLILIDELFKGTNIQDAMKCSNTVIDGLIKNKKSVFVLSTHLYEIADDLKRHQNICFNYFETEVKNDQLHFSYQLKPGISNDRLGYLIMKKEGVVRMLEEI
jgi:DNA mismatch repair protein MutS